MTGAERRRIAEIAAAIILSVSTFISSWAGYQANLWDGEQAAHYAEANAERVASGRLATGAGQFEGADVLMFSQWLDAHARSDRRLEDYYHEQFRPEFARAFDAWLALHPARNLHAPRSPFGMPDYRSATMDRSIAAGRRADGQFAAGQKANDISDAFENGAVFLAFAMFLCGITQTFETTAIRTVLLTVGALACLVGIARIMHLPTLALHGS